MLKFDTSNPAEALTIHLELTGIAEGIIDNYKRIEIKNIVIIVRNKKDGFRSISFDYKNISKDE